MDRTWRWTVGTGMALVALTAVHLIAQHFVVDDPGGLRSYQQVLDYIANPLIFAIESGLLVTVTVHGLIGVHRILLDFDLPARVQRRVDAGLWTLGALTISYGFVVLITLATRA
jgi:succinate dehydrogenase hydrophobic anchor subunit